MERVSLSGGAEFSGEMASLDRRLMEAAGGPKTAVRIIPAAAAPDKNAVRAGENGVSWFSKLGATDVRSLPLTDWASADKPEIVAALLRAGLIYMLGGFPGHLAASLSGSRAWEAMRKACAGGAVIAGSSAGAMVLCEHFFDPYDNRLVPGLNMVPNACVLPHHNTFGKNWAPRLRRLIPGSILIGIDEQTGLLGDSPAGPWQVHGGGSVVIYHHDRMKRYRSGETFQLN